MPFNLLSQPVWVFDIENRCMWWANESALELWNAESLETLLERDFASDMSDATARTLGDYLTTFRSNDTVTARWTYYPTGKGPTTVDVLLSGMYDNEGRLLMLNEGHIVPTQEINKESLRGVEMLKHLPVSVCQFDANGTLIHQNPEALEVFGNPIAAEHNEAATIATTCTRNKKKRKSPPTNDDSDGEGSCASATTTKLGSIRNKNHNINNKCHFRSRFVDEELGQRIFDEVVNGGKDYCIDAQQYTNHGIRWGSIKVRRARDPVTGCNSILYSARDITDVIEAKKEADEANARKSEFLAVMAHEIRTPLHQVIGTIDVLGETHLNKEQTGYLDLLQSGALSLMAVINDLLDYTKLEAGKMDLECVPFDPKAVIDGSVAAVSGRAEEKGLQIDTCFDNDEIPSEIMGDPNRLRQIMLNLLSNAVKFTHEGNVVARITTRKTHEDCRSNNHHHGCNTKSKKCRVLRFEVQDTGIGIAPDFQKEIFGKYHQADCATSRKYGGTGLGLAICERLVSMMGGRIGLDSEVGKGSKFWFELNFDCCNSTKQQQQTNNNSSSVDIETDPAAKSTSSSLAAQTPPTGVTSPSMEGKDMVHKSLNVLVAEDNKVNQRVVTAMLKRLGHTPTIVENGQLAVEKLTSTTATPKFDMVLMDVQMPILDGIEATKLIRSLGIDCPVIGLTASFQRKELPLYHKIGMNDCISKPIRLDGLRCAINKNNQNQKMRTTAAICNASQQQESSSKRSRYN